MSVDKDAATTAALVAAPPETGATFPLLDTFRAVGALAVLTTHTAFWAGDYTRHGVVGTLLGRLDVGVAIFFVLSGFLLSRGWLTRAAHHRRAPRVAAYLWKRMLRIVPIYVVAAVLALALIRANRDLGVWDWVSALLLLEVYHGDGFPDGLTQMWSLSVEVAFYLALPSLMWLLVGRRGSLHVGRVLSGLVGLVAISLWWHLDGAARIDGGRPLEWLPAYLTWFAVGILFALVEGLHSRGERPRLTAPFVALSRQPGVCWTMALALMLVSATPLAGPTMLSAPTTTEALTKHLLYAAIGGLIVLSGIFSDPAGRFARLLGRPAPRHLGWISYGVFCLHLPILHFVMWSTGWTLFHGRGLAIWVLTVVLSLLAAELGYRVVERPALRHKDWVRERSEPDDATATAIPDSVTTKT